MPVFWFVVVVVVVVVVVLFNWLFFFCSSSPPGSRGPSPPEPAPDRSVARDPHERGRRRRRRRPSSFMMQNSPFPFSSLIGHWRKTLFSLFVPHWPLAWNCLFSFRPSELKPPPFLFLGKATHCSFLFYIPNMRLTKLNAVYIYIYLCGKTPPLMVNPPFLFW